jgi:hypothetical protein
MLLITAVLGGAGTWIVMRNLPKWSRDAIVTVVEDSPLPADQKERVVAQVDRVVRQYQEGQVGPEQLGELVERLSQSAMFSLLVMNAAQQKYVVPSGLEEQEKQEADVTLKRLVLGLHEQRIAPQDLEPVLDYISMQDANGNRQLHNQVSDDQLRAMLADCDRLANQAQVAAGEFQLDVADEIESIVEETLTAAL